MEKPRRGTTHLSLLFQIQGILGDSFIGEGSHSWRKLGSRLPSEYSSTFIRLLFLFDLREFPLWMIIGFAFHFTLVCFCCFFFVFSVRFVWGLKELWKRSPVKVGNWLLLWEDGVVARGGGLHYRLTSGQTEEEKLWKKDTYEHGWRTTYRKWDHHSLSSTHFFSPFLSF